jgi:catechol 2,3-dioxygenase-like lactoylglutathione lyase family enzyme
MGRNVPLCTAGLKVELRLIKNAFAINSRQPGCRCAPIRARSRNCGNFFSHIQAKEVAMESIISDLVSRFEKGALSRRELVSGLAILAASGTAAAGQEGLDFKDANIDHISIHVADLQRSVDFYQKMFGFTVVSQDQPGGIIRLGNAKVLVSLNHGSPAGIVDHFAIGIPRFSRESAARYLTQRGATPLEGDYAGLHVKDPDGINVQISQRA